MNYTRAEVCDLARAAEKHCADLARLIEADGFPDVHLPTVGPRLEQLNEAAYNLRNRTAAARW